MRLLIAQLADIWAQDLSRPKPSVAVLAHWDTLLAAWADEVSLPISVRKAANNRGSVLPHASGRRVVPTDNSPAHWAFALAVLGKTPSLDWVRDQVETDCVPVAMILKGSERAAARFTCTLGRIESPNAAGWKEV